MWKHNNEQLYKCAATDVETRNPAGTIKKKLRVKAAKFVGMNGRIACIVLWAAVWMVLPAVLRGQEYVPAATGCRVEFKAVSHKDGEVIRGVLNSVKGKIIFDPKNVGAASFDINVGLAGITSGATKINAELRKPAYFNPVKYPVIKIKSTSVKADGASGVVYVMQGNLTIKDVTKPVHIQFTASPMGGGYIFRGRLVVSKQAFNVGSKEDGIDDEVSVYIEVRALQNQKSKVKN